MSYIPAEAVLPRALIQQIQQYVSGASIYIPSKEKKHWGSQTQAKHYYQARNQQIWEKHTQGTSTGALAREYSLSEKSIQRILRSYRPMYQPQYITLRQQPQWKQAASAWFHSKWGVAEEAYLACMEAYLAGETEYGWYLCIQGDAILGGLGVIDNDFHDRPELSPNLCAVYTEEAFRCQGIAGRLLNMAVAELKDKGISPVYLVTDHVGFYERYGWEFLCLVQGHGEPEMTRMYIHR